MLRSWLSGLALQGLVTSVLADDVKTLGPWQQHLTEPYHRSTIINVLAQPNDTSLLDDSYIFITPYVSDYRVGSFGPQIFKSDGTLIWNGNYTAKVRAMDAHVCDYKGIIGQHICYNDARPVEQAGHSAGAIRFFDNTYRQVGPDYGAEGDLRAPDIHELNTPPAQRGETFIQDIYEIKRMDLTPYKGPQDGYVLDGCFQEVELRTKKVVFEWCALDWMHIYDTYLYLHAVNSENYSLPISGNGAMEAPWDFFHINAIARNLEGDYAVSGRHLNTIFKIAGKDNPHGADPGSILWRLGGKNNDFEMDFNFSRQHTVRFHQTGPEESVISLFDNAFDGWWTSANYSTGKMISVNNATKTAHLIAQYDDPEKHLSFSQGSVQLLDNGNVFISWGNRHYLSEFTYQGELLYHASFTGDIETFRAWKFPWKGYPTYPPKILGYAQNCSGSQYAYVSWNGATEVQSWRLFSSWGTQHGPWHWVGTVPKAGFETSVNLSATAPSLDYAIYAPYMYVEALGADGSVLGTSLATHTYVPINETVFRKFECNETMCGKKYFRFDEKWSCGASCARSHVAAIYVVVGLMCAVELAVWAYARLCWERVKDDKYVDSDIESDFDFDDLDVDEMSTAYEKPHAKRRTSFADGYTGNIPLATFAEKSPAAAGHGGTVRPRGNSSANRPFTFASGNCNPSPERRSSLSNGITNLMKLAGISRPSPEPQPSTEAAEGHQRRWSTQVRAENDLGLEVSNTNGNGPHERRRSRSITKLNVPKRGMPGRPGSACRVKASGTDREFASPV